MRMQEKLCIFVHNNYHKAPHYISPRIVRKMAKYKYKI